jgi:hypothetical protein
MSENEKGLLDCIKKLNEGLVLINQGLIKLDARLTELENSPKYSPEQYRRIQ